MLSTAPLNRRDLRLVHPYGVAIKYGKPMPATELFADHVVVTLTPAGERALQTGVLAVDEGAAGEGRRSSRRGVTCWRCSTRPSRMWCVRSRSAAWRARWA
ncbi:hypothetical protein GCM10027199_08920 [Amycolatopsis magusensis]